MYMSNKITVSKAALYRRVLRAAQSNGFVIRGHHGREDNWILIRKDEVVHTFQSFAAVMEYFHILKGYERAED